MRTTSKTESSGTAEFEVQTRAQRGNASASATKRKMPDYQRGVSPGDEIVREPQNDARFISGHAPRSDGYPRRDDGLGAHFFEDGSRDSNHRDEFLG